MTLTRGAEFDYDLPTFDCCAQMPIFIKHLSGSRSGKVESFEKDRIKVGRAAASNTVIDLKYDPQADTIVSRNHAEIYRDGESFVLLDTSSSFGTFLNRKEVNKNEPTIIKDGDTLQFGQQESIKGPHVSFYTYEPPEDGGETIVGEKPTLDNNPVAGKKAGVLEKIKPAIPYALIGLGCIALIALGYFLFQWRAPVLLASAAGYLVVVGAGYTFWRYRQTHRRAPQLPGEPHSRDIVQKWEEVRKSLQSSKRSRAGEQPLNAYPWVLVLGDPNSGKTSLLKAAGHHGTVASTNRGGSTANCDWYFFNDIVILDTAGRYVARAEGSSSSEDWKTLLKLLRKERPRLPINGVIVALSAEDLVGKSIEDLKKSAARFRTCVDELMHELGIRFPVHVVITKGDQIAGFTEFFGALPETAKREQAIGYANPTQEPDLNVKAFLARAMETLVRRLERLSVDAFNYANLSNPGTERGIFMFSGELRALRAPLEEFLSEFLKSHFSESPLFRGFFFTSVHPFASSPKSRWLRRLGIDFARLNSQTTATYFVDDLFAKILPQDSRMATPTETGTQRLKLRLASRRILVFALCLAFAAILTLSFLNNRNALLAFEIGRKPCAILGSASGAAAKDIVTAFDGCRESIEALAPRTFWRSLPYRFGLGQAIGLRQEMEQSFVTAFRAKVIQPIDTRLIQTLSDGSVSAIAVSALIRRIARLKPCLHKGNCSDSDSIEANYQRLLGVLQPLPRGDKSFEQFLRAHEAYFAWQKDSSALQALHDRNVRALTEWSKRGKLTESWIMESARGSFEPVRITDFGVSPSKNEAEVGEAYTSKAWKDLIEPLFAELDKIAGDDVELRKTQGESKKEYRDRALLQWLTFLKAVSESDFRVGTELTSLLAEDSPYYRVLETANDSLRDVLQERWTNGLLPPWAVTLKQFAIVRRSLKNAKPQAQSATKEDGERSVQLMRDYITAASDFRSKIGSPDLCLTSAKSAFRERIPSDKAEHPLLKAQWALSKLRGSKSTTQNDEEFVWRLLERPLVLAWRAALVQAGGQIQMSWIPVQSWASGKEKKDPKEAGEIAEKVLGFAGNKEAGAGYFLKYESGMYARESLFNESVPFTDEFLSYLRSLRNIQRDGNGEAIMKNAPVELLVSRS